MNYIISTKYDGTPRKCFPKKCKNCKEIFYVPKHRLKQTKFCSKSCRQDSISKNKTTAVCAWCNIEFYISPSKMKNSKSGLHFCSRECKDTAQQLDGLKEIHPSHYGNGEGEYRKLAFRNLPHKCNLCGWNESEDILQVHHKDSNRNNRDLSNLEILCPNCHWTITLKKLKLRRK